MTTITKKHTNEGHEGKVPMGGSIATVFVVGIIVGGFVTFLAVAGRTQGVIEQRRELKREGKLREFPLATPPAAQAEPTKP
ncbi:MAG: hypothetical protein EOP10_15305 [Proteobacteria bacterium]|nr:MAG: hypothetical protein EOP10_15305 [Pseudomonadota bacterium]